MVKKNDCSSSKKQIVNKGAWTAQEDQKLADYIATHGDRKWGSIPARAGLNRCGKSCRLRWLNYLKPGIKRGNISEDEEDLIIRLHNLLGNRWSLIAGRLPGRTDNEIKNHWNTHLSKKSLSINDLNLKLNQKSNSPQVPLPATDPAGAQILPTPHLTPSEISRPISNDFAGLHNVQNSRPWNELPDKDFDIDEFFDFRDSHLLGTGPLSGEEAKVQEASEFQEFHFDGIYQNLLNTELQGSSDDHSPEQEKYDRLDMDALTRLLDYDEEEMLLSLC